MSELQLATLIEEKALRERIRQIGASLTEKFRSESVVALCVLKGSFIFFSDLVRKIDLDLSCDFVGVSSYSGMQSSGNAKLTLDVSLPLKDKHVILVEDIVDTGYTMKFLCEHLSQKEPKSLTTVTLLHKPDAEKVKAQLDYVGFKIGNDFVVGYGLDYLGFYRHLPYVATISNLN